MNNVLGIISANYRSDELGALSDRRPLGAIPFSGRYRLIDFALSSMCNSGIRTVGVITPNQYRPLADHLGAGKPWGLDRRNGGLFILPCSTPDLQFKMYKFALSNFIANKEILYRDSADYVIVSGCNHVFNQDFTEMIEEHKRSGADITLAYKERVGHVNKSAITIETDERNNVVSFNTNTGEGETVYQFADIFVFNRKLLINFIENCVDAAFTDLFDIVAANSGLLSIKAYGISGYFGSIYDVNDYFRCSMELMEQEVRKEMFLSENKIYTKVKDNPPAKYGKNSLVCNSLVGSGCRVSGTISDSIVFRDCIIEEDVTIKNCIIMQHCHIRKGSRIENVIIDKGVQVSEATTIVGTSVKPLIIPKNTEL